MRGVTLSLFLLTSLFAHGDLLQDYQEKQHQLTLLVKQEQKHIEKQQLCLAQAIYFEATHNETSQRAVGNVIINRVLDQSYPHTICDVIHHKVIIKSTGKKVCQFSYLCEKNKQIIYNSLKWNNAKRIATELIEDTINGVRNDLTKGATHFHDSRVYPSWAKTFKRTVKIEKLSFYKMRGN